MTQRTDLRWRANDSARSPRNRTSGQLVAARSIYQAAGFRLISEEPHHSFGHDLVERPVVPRGEGMAFVRDGHGALGGKLPINTGGGALGEGRLHGMTDWRPQRAPRRVLEDIVGWIGENERTVEGALA